MSNIQWARGRVRSSRCEGWGARNGLNKMWSGLLTDRIVLCIIKVIIRA